MGIVMEAAAHHPELPWIVGGTILLGLLIALRIVWGYGKSRPHS